MLATAIAARQCQLAWLMVPKAVSSSRFSSRKVEEAEAQIPRWHSQARHRAAGAERGRDMTCRAHFTCGTGTKCRSGQKIGDEA